jgi:type IV pilus assembly protein PilC
MNRLKTNFDMFRKKPTAKKTVVKERPSKPKLSFSMPKMNLSMPKIKFPKIEMFSYASFSIKKQTFFAKRLSFLIKAGVPMLESIHVIKGQTKSKSEIRVFDKIISDVSNGQTLAGSLNKFKGVFGNFTINIIKAGESSGTLTQNLSYLADELKKKELLKKKIMSSLLYPLIVTIATFGITGFLVVYIFPKITPIFSSFSAELPLSTRILMHVTNVLRNDGVYIFIGLAFLTLIIFLLIKYVAKVRYFYDGLVIRLPIVGGIVKNYNLTNVNRTLGLLLKSGSSLTDALLVTADTTENTNYKKYLTDASHMVLRGKSMTEVLAKAPVLFPPMLGHMLTIGEKSGNLSNTLIYLSEYYENEFEEITKNLSSTIEPVLMIVMGIMVGFVAISVITPIYEITNKIHK